MGQRNGVSRVAGLDFVQKVEEKFHFRKFEPAPRQSLTLRIQPISAFSLLPTARQSGVCRDPGR